MLALLLLAAPAPGELLFWNARLAQREGRPEEVLKLWMVHNQVPATAQEPHFRSLVWAALGELGICPDDFADDLDGAGLWPIAVHNWIARGTLRRAPPEQPNPFGAFALGLQKRFVTLHDRLSSAELHAAQWFQSKCRLPARLAAKLLGILRFDGKDRMQMAQALRRLLQLSRLTLQEGQLRHRAVIEARIFDLNIAIADLATREARRLARAEQRLAKAEKVELPALVRPDPAEQDAILRGSLDWHVDDWLALSRDRRLALFAHARRIASDHPGLDALVLHMIDALQARGEGEEVAVWIGARARTDRAWQAAIYTGERGEGLLSLDPQSGFRERGALALHRGVAFLEQGALFDALRSFAFALREAPSSAAADTVAGLSRRWLSYALSRHQTDRYVLQVLAALVPRGDYNAIVEDLVWRAAFARDTRSFELCTDTARQVSAFSLRVERLRHLAYGRMQGFRRELEEALATEPHLSLRFLQRLVDRLALEERSIREDHVVTLDLLLRLVVPFTDSDQRSVRRRAQGLVDRMSAMRDGVAGADDSREAVRRLGPGNDTFAGSIRLAPSDPLPWPFAPRDTVAPSPLGPIALTALEWQHGGERVYGWRLGGD
jgi:hypothetical protein